MTGKGLIGRMVAASVLVLYAGMARAQDNYANWTKSAVIKLNTSATGANVVTNQTSFPVLVRLSMANAPSFFAAEGTSHGADLRFSKTDGTHLPYEMTFDAVNNKVTAWVKVDTVFGNSTTQQIKFYWGNASAADSSNSAAVFSASNGFLGTYHLTKALSDSSNTMHLFKDASGLNGNAYGGATVTDTDGPFDRARAFHCMGAQGADDNEGDSVIIPGIMNKPATLTLSCWVRVDSIDQYNQSANGHRANIISMCNIVSLNDAGADGTNVDSFYMGYYGGNWNNYGYVSPNYSTTNTGHALLQQRWKYVAGMINPTAGYAAIFLNGDSVAQFANTSAINWGSGTKNTKIGKEGTTDNGEKLGGSVCEVRFESVERSADWEHLCFRNQGPTDLLTNVVAGPTAPVLSTPSNGASISGTSVTLAWNSASADSYRLQVSNTSTFSTTFFDQSGISTTSKALSGLTPTVTYYWRVNSKNVSGEGGFSPAWSFITLGTVPTPVLSSPTNNATTVTTPTTLSWGAVSGASSYNVQVSLAATFATTAYSQNVTAATATASNLGYNTSYYWRVIASATGGNSFWSNTWMFTTQYGKPVAPTLTAPTNGATGASISSVALSWSTSAYSQTYTVQVSTSSTFNSTVANKTALSSTSSSVTGLAVNTTYYWRVQGANPGLTGDWSAIWSFKTVISATHPVIDLTKASFSVRNSLLEYTLPNPGSVEITVQNLLGRTELAIRNKQSAGHFSVNLKRYGLTPGKHFVRFKSGLFAKSTAIIVAR